MRLASVAMGGAKAIVGGAALLFLLLWGVNAFVFYQYRYKRRPRVQCIGNLERAYTGQLNLFHTQRRYSEQLADIHFEPHGDRYTYFLSEEQPAGHRTAANSTSITRSELPAYFTGGLHLGVMGQCSPTWGLWDGMAASSPCVVTIACAGQLDSDPTLDVWSISTARRSTAAGQEIRPGEPFHEVNDEEQ
jgi:hypothetical protein